MELIKSNVMVWRLFPNIVTLLGLCSGLTSIKCSFMGSWESALVFIIIACFVDAMDGRIARLMRATSDFGAQLDSLADFLNFGVAPAILMYFWYLKDFDFLGWTLVMLFVICMALRLARFNSTIIERSSLGLLDKNFFTGVPAPVGALLVLFPLMLSLNGKFDLLLDSFGKVEISIYMLVVSFLVISRVPTFSAKQVRIPSNYSSIFMLCLVLVVIFSVTKPWITFPILAVFYVISIPISSYCYYKAKGKIV